MSIKKGNVNVQVHKSGIKSSAIVPSISKVTIRNAADVDTSKLKNGSLLQYNSSTNKFEAVNTIETEEITLNLNGGNF